jgi:hypothetical protein
LAEPEYDIGICTVEVSASKVGHCGSGPSEEDAPSEHDHSESNSAREGDARNRPLPPYLLAYGGPATSSSVSGKRFSGQRAEVQTLAQILPCTEHANPYPRHERARWGLG